jgi:hypothetical protein
MLKNETLRFKRLLLVAALTLVTAVSSWAGFEEEVAKDLAVKSAYLVAPVGQLWLIDIDAKQGVQTGDLFTVVERGAPIVHPVTGDVIGTLDEVKAVLKVTRVKAGYSYVNVLKSEGELKAGDEIKRFAGLNAIFWDYTGQGEPVFTDLQAALPELDWESYVAAQEGRPQTPEPQPGMDAGLVFVLTDQGLAVKDSSFQPIRFYRSQELADQPAPAPVAAAPVGQLSSSTRLTAPAPQAAGIVAAPQQGTAMQGESGGSSMFGGLFSSGPQPIQGQRGGLIVSNMDSRAGVYYGPRMHGHPIGVEVGDFDGDGKNDVALCFKDRLVLAHVENGQFTPLAEHAFGSYGSALSLSAIDLDNNGQLEFYVSVVTMNSVSSTVLELRDGQLTRVIENVPFFLNVVSLGSDGDVLLGQELNPDLTDHEHDLSGPVFRVTRSGNSLQRGSVLQLPATTTLFGFLPFEAEGRPLLANLNINDKLQVLEMGGAPMWESGEYFGGSEASFERPDGMVEMGSRYAFLKPNLKPGPNGTILAPVNEGNRLFGSLRQYKSSHLRAVSFDGYSLVERWRTKPQGGYMADFTMADADNDGVDEIVMLVMFAHGSWFKTKYGNSALLIYEMQ